MPCPVRKLPRVTVAARRLERVLQLSDGVCASRCSLHRLHPLQDPETQGSETSPMWGWKLAAVPESLHNTPIRESPTLSATHRVGWSQ
jgi:hypothetical protein